MLREVWCRERLIGTELRWRSEDCRGGDVCERWFCGLRGLSASIFNIESAARGPAE